LIYKGSEDNGKKQIIADLVCFHPFASTVFIVTRQKV